MSCSCLLACPTLTKLRLALKRGRSPGSRRYIIKKAGYRHASLALCEHSEPLWWCVRGLQYIRLVFKAFNLSVGDIHVAMTHQM